MEEDKNQSPSPATPKQDQVTVPDEDPKMTSTLETANTTGAEVSDVSQKTVRDACQGLNFGPYGGGDQVEGVKVSRLAAGEGMDASAPISLAPTLPSPMSRPEKKTYCCAECGKEYASRSGLKVRKNHLIIYLLLISSLVTTHPPFERAFSSQT